MPECTQLVSRGALLFTPQRDATRLALFTSARALARGAFTTWIHTP